MNMVRKIKAAQSRAGIGQDEHVANVLQISNNVTNSCTGLTPNQQQALLTRYNGMAAKKPLNKSLRLIFSLWGQLASAGKVDEDSKEACENWCKTYTDGTNLYKANDHWGKLINMLKQWLAREVPNG
ncbi:hypothetical protein [Pseudoalteromonas sp. R3]|uniref:hypothetical protein n=1 Tax=Pseudoalteromonas sp. R3 TaxID=1709477 RepID=UPI0006B47323|nr:hypothetical protein [Pseudoalteromonas sp. R3]AZZ98276.1 hypothetical protein ELR70_14810 [Pseudoalteromonas sp. R3]